MAGIRQIAREARVSIATVSRVLNGAPTVDAALAEQVQAAAARLGYRPNGVARSLRLQRTLTLGAVIPTITNPYFTDTVRAMQDVAAGAGYTLLVANSDRDPQKEETALATLLDRRVDGVILVSAATEPGPSPALRALLDAGTPVVAMDRALPTLEIDRVVVDTRAGAHAAVRHLIQTGRRRIAFVAGPPTISTAVEKLLGYMAALEEAGIPREESLILPGDYTLESGEAMAERLLALRRTPDASDAVLVANNLMTLGVFRTLLRADVRIPQDLAVVGYDDVPWTDAVRPALTIVSQPTYELGQEAVRLLLGRLRESRSSGGAPASPVFRTLPARLVIRESTLGHGMTAGSGEADTNAERGMAAAPSQREAKERSARTRSPVSVPAS
jgi:LacI family transcriptional regulator